MFQNKYIRFFIFLGANFLALYLGILLMNNGPRTEWYLSLNKSPLTPPGWVFGAAWTTIMVLFSFYMTKLSYQFKTFDKNLIMLYVSQWILNVSWNFIFFNQHQMKLGFVIITLLWLLIGFFTFKYIRKLKLYSILVSPYLIWMTIAVNLNLFIIFYN